MNFIVEVVDGITPMLQAMEARGNDLAVPITEILEAEKGRAQQLREAGIPPPIRASTERIRRFRGENNGIGQVSEALAAATPEVAGTTGTLAVRGPGPAVQQKGIELGRMMIFGHPAPNSFLAARPYLFWHEDQVHAHANTILNYIVANA